MSAIYTTKEAKEIEKQIARLRDPNNHLGMRIAAYDYLLTCQLTPDRAMCRNIYLPALKRALKHEGEAKFEGVTYSFVGGQILRRMG